MAHDQENRNMVKSWESMPVSETLFERFECIAPPRHWKFYELETELSLFYPKVLIRRWGRIGTTRPRTKRHICDSPEEMETLVRHVRRRRQRRGYHLVYADKGQCAA